MSALAPSVTASPEPWVDDVTSRLTPMAACAVIEQQFGVRPLVEAYFAAVGDAPATLALFTPTPHHTWGAAMLNSAAVPADGVQVEGKIWTPNQAASRAIVLLRDQDEECHLAWLDHDAPGVERAAAGWIGVEHAIISPEKISRPVTLHPNGELHQQLDRYARIWALVAVACARRGILAVRCAVRTTGFGRSQMLAMAVTEAEIETELTAAAARLQIGCVDPGSGVILALAAARTLATVSACALDLRDQCAIDVDTPLAQPGMASALTGFVGGLLTLEQELARVAGVGASA